jgi:hypothetical protein
MCISNAERWSPPCQTLYVPIRACLGTYTQIIEVKYGKGKHIWDIDENDRIPRMKVCSSPCSRARDELLTTRVGMVVLAPILRPHLGFDQDLHLPPLPQNFHLGVGTTSLLRGSGRRHHNKPLGCRYHAYLLHSPGSSLGP